MNGSATAEGLVADRCVCEIGEIDGLTSPCSVCPQAVISGQSGEYPDGCPLAAKAVTLDVRPWWQG